MNRNRINCNRLEHQVFKVTLKSKQTFSRSLPICEICQSDSLSWNLKLKNLNLHLVTYQYEV